MYYTTYSSLFPNYYITLYYISIFQYGDKEIKSENEDIYDQVKVDKQYNAKIEITTYKDGTKDYDVLDIISGIKK